jgi:hypothetical protein
MLEPLKADVDFNINEWNIGKSMASDLVNEELILLRAELELLKESAGKSFGKRTLRNVMRSLDEHSLDFYDINSPYQKENEIRKEVREKAQEAMNLEDYIFELMRRNYSSSSLCTSKYDCPDIYLSFLADRIGAITSLFISHDLASRFFPALPRHLEDHFEKSLADNKQLEVFVRENPEMKIWLELRFKKSILEEALQKIQRLESRGASENGISTILNTEKESL